MSKQIQHVTVQDQIVAKWLFCVAGLVFFMIVLGGLTRLTESGLSMVEWRPVTGWFPPLSEAEWQRVFAMYQQTPEFMKVNSDMTLAEFEGIFWLEYLHRLLGRIIGLAYFVPFAYFVLKGWVRGHRRLTLFGLLVLGGLQGGMGWFMVKSGLVDRPDVSQYRLAAHLILAMIIFMCLVWCGLRFAKGPTIVSENVGRLRPFSRFVVFLVLFTAFSGALVAGLDAGLTYNTFPLMDGDLIPPGLFEMQPAYLNLFESHLTVQFNHRVLAIFTFLVILAFCGLVRRSNATKGPQRLVNYLALAVCAQVVLGITTLLLVVPINIAVMHQAGAVVLLGLATGVAFSLQGPCKNQQLKSP